MPGRPRPRAYAVTSLALGGAAALVLALAACGQPTPQSPDDSVAPTVSVPVQPTITRDTPDDDLPDATPTAAGGSDLYDASSSLSGTKCVATGESWSFSGTLKNSDTQEHTFTVAVFLMKNSDGSNVAEKEVDVKLAAGATAPVSIPDFATAPKTGVQCVSGVTVKGL